ncbi:hypothetical protein pipiens_010435 [Culex pipiens pipiens]|uniref:Uncharacterized protein n=2 Tax=Culex pipiens pipiens TaxID=38569 RepID=A0ABD1DA93_CULPP
MRNILRKQRVHGCENSAVGQRNFIHQYKVEAIVVDIDAGVELTKSIGGCQSFLFQRGVHPDFERDERHRVDVLAFGNKSGDFHILDTKALDRKFCHLVHGDGTRNPCHVQPELRRWCSHKHGAKARSGLSPGRRDDVGVNEFEFFREAKLERISAFSSNLPVRYIFFFGIDINA